MTQFVALCKCC